MPELMNPNREAFCQRMSLDMPKREAYLEVFGCSLKTAGPGASRLLKNGEIQNRIFELRSDLSDRMNYTKDKLFNELVTMSLFNPATFVREDGTWKDLTEIPSSVSKMITSIKITRVKGKEGELCQIIDLKFVDPLKVYEMIGRMLGAFNDNVNINQQHRFAIERIELPQKKRLGEPVDEVLLSAENNSD